MNDLKFTFEENSLSEYVCAIAPGSILPATQLLFLLEDADEMQIEDIFQQLEEKGIELDLSGLEKPVLGAEMTKRLQLEERLVEKGLSPEQLDAADPLRLYLEELAGIPACGDPVLLSRELAIANKDGKNSDELRAHLVNLRLSRVVELAGELAGRGVLLLDLIQEGSIGLWRATERFTGNDFENDCDTIIRFHLAKAVIMASYEAGVGQKLRAAAEDYRSVDERLLGELGRSPTTEEIAEALHMSVAETAAVAQVLANARMLNHTLKPEPEEIPQEEDQAVEDTAYFQMRQRIAELLSVLESRDAQILTLRYGLEGGLPLSHGETAEKLGISIDEVIALETAALAKLRTQN